MCGRYVLESLMHLPEDLSERFNIRQIGFDLLPTFNAAPSQLLPVVIETASGERELRLMQWGLKPRWAARGKPIPPPINARVETLGQKPMFRGLLAGQRCLVPVSGFYEWATTGGRKQPYYIHNADEPILALAGLWDNPTADGAEEAEESGDQTAGSFAIVTMESTGAMTRLHHRMPVILSREQEEEWLDPARTGSGANAVLQTVKPPDLEAYPVSPAVNNVRNNTPALINRLEQGEIWPVTIPD